MYNILYMLTIVYIDYKLDAFKWKVKYIYKSCYIMYTI